MNDMTKVIIKNGIAGIEINGRFYTHTHALCLARVIGADAFNGARFIAMPTHGRETVICVDAQLLDPIPNPALSWPAGTKVMVRDNDVSDWKVSYFNKLSKIAETVLDCEGQSWNPYKCGFSRMTQTVMCIEGYHWNQCKLAESE